MYTRVADSTGGGPGRASHNSILPSKQNRLGNAPRAVSSAATPRGYSISHPVHGTESTKSLWRSIRRAALPRAERPPYEAIILQTADGVARERPRSINPLAPEQHWGAALNRAPQPAVVEP